MYLFEMQDLPKKADKALLEWDNATLIPIREKNRIAMPRNPTNIYYPLQNGRQFLMKTKIAGGGVWFGGTDEEPFLVEMNKEVLDFYIDSEGKEQSFYRKYFTFVYVTSALRT
jgi:hypothetical protein